MVVYRVTETDRSTAFHPVLTLRMEQHQLHGGGTIKMDPSQTFQVFEIATKIVKCYIWKVAHNRVDGDVKNN